MELSADESIEPGYMYKVLSDIIHHGCYIEGFLLEPCTDEYCHAAKSLF